MKKTIFCLLVSTVLIGGTAQAALVSVFDPGTSSLGTVAKIIAAPASVESSTAAGGASNTGQEGFDEMQGVLLGAALGVDGGSIAAGTVVDSHMIFMNQEDSVLTELTHFDVEWTFSGTILGVMSVNDGSDKIASNSFLGAAGTTYQAVAGGNRGLEPNPPSPDFYSIAGSVLTFDTRVSQPGDWIRVITQGKVPDPVVPAPGAVVLASIGMSIVGWYRRRTLVG